jgi:hypothetical protein
MEMCEWKFLQSESNAGGSAMNSAHAPDAVQGIVVWNTYHCAFDATTALQKQMPGSEVKNMKRHNREKR